MFIMLSDRVNFRRQTRSAGGNLIKMQIPVRYLHDEKHTLCVLRFNYAGHNTEQTIKKKKKIRPVSPRRFTIVINRCGR